MTIDANLDKRLSRIVRRHERMKRNGVVHSVGRDGLIRTRPRLIRPSVPYRGVVVATVLLILFKAVLFAQMGAADYDARIETLRGGTSLEQAGALLLQKEPVTVMLGGYIAEYFFDV